MLFSGKGVHCTRKIHISTCANIDLPLDIETIRTSSTIPPLKNVLLSFFSDSFILGFILIKKHLSAITGHFSI